MQQYNGYGEDKLQCRNRQIQKQLDINRESLRESILRRERISKIDESVAAMAKIVEKYTTFPEDLNYHPANDYLIGVFDDRVIPNYRQYSGEFRS